MLLSVCQLVLGLGGGEEDMVAVVMCYNLHLPNCLWIAGGGVEGRYYGHG